MITRNTRDEILLQGLDLASAVTIKAHDAPGGVIASNAWSIKWLQSALDMHHRLYPFSSDIQEIGMTIQTGTSDVILQTPASHSIYLPDDFMIDVRNGLFTTTSNIEYNLGRIDYQRWQKRRLSFQLTTSSMPLVYTVVQKRIKVLPVTQINMSATLHYYALPAVPHPGDFLEFPDDETLIEFIRLKAQEWMHSRGVNPGDAQSYMIKQLARFRSSGLLHTSEYDDGIPLENEHVIPEPAVVNRNAWMGQFTT